MFCNATITFFFNFPNFFSTSLYVFQLICGNVKAKNIFNFVFTMFFNRNIFLQ